MGRFLSGGGGSTPRSQIITLTASNPTLAIPSWAQGGKGILRVTGCGGGGGGGAGAGGFAGGNGAGGAFADRWSILIPSGRTTVNAVVAAAGTGGNVGGNTEVSFNSDTFARLRLSGGGAGGAASGAAGVNNGGAAAVLIGPGNAALSDLGIIRGAAGQASEQAVVDSAWHMTMFPFRFGSPANRGTNSGGAVDRATPWGVGSVGYGGGGTGGASGQPGNAGGPGLLILEFVEAL